MKALTVKEYAVKNKISIFNVIKMAKSGKVPSETRKVEGKDELFILTEEAPQVETPKKEEIIDYKKAYFELERKYDELLRKVESEKEKK